MKKLILIIFPVLLLTAVFVLTLVFPFQKVTTTMLVREFGAYGQVSTNDRIKAYLNVGSIYNSQLVGSADDLIDADGQNLIGVLIWMEATNISPLTASNVEAWITSSPEGISVWKEETVVTRSLSRWSSDNVALMILIMRRDGRTDQEIQQLVSKMKVNVLFYNSLIKGKQRVSLDEIQLIQP